MLCPETKGTDNPDQPLRLGLSHHQESSEKEFSVLGESEEMKDTASRNSALVRGGLFTLWSFEIKISLTTHATFLLEFLYKLRAEFGSGSGA